MMNRFQTYRNDFEVLDVVIDEWCDAERETRPNHATKIELKEELGRAVGLGNSDGTSAALKGIYRYCSGETPLSITKALAICRYIGNYELIQWIGYHAEMIMTPRAQISRLDELDAADILDEIVQCLKDTTGFVEALSSTYQARPCQELITKIEAVFFRTTLQMERCRLMFRKLIEKMMRPGSQGEIWLGFPEPKKGRKHA